MRRCAVNNAARFFALSLLVLTPCFWHSRIQAGDLSSHVYNAWLSGQLERHPVPGVQVVQQHSNVLFDLLLAYALQLFGTDAGTKTAVATCVLVFFWGAFLFVRAVAGRMTWWSAPCLAMLTYGWTFHMGLFNFLLSLGLCLFAIAGWLSDSRGMRFAAMGLLLFAVAAHPLPVVWAIGTIAMIRLAAAYPYWFFPAGLVTLTLLHFAVVSWIPVRWSWRQRLFMTGADQLIPFGMPYLLIAFGTLALVTTMLAKQSKARGFLEWLRNPQLQVLVLLSVSILAMPSAVMIADYRMPLDFMPQRMSLTVALMACAIASAAPAARWQQGCFWILMITYGTLLYRDTDRFNRIEDTVMAATSRLESEPRVVIAAAVPQMRINLFTHMVDRSCVRHCFSYANYEPCTLQFRIKASDKNHLVTASCEDSVGMQTGTYVVKASDPSLLQLNVCPGNHLSWTSLEPGQLAGRAVCLPSTKLSEYRRAPEAP